MSIFNEKIKQISLKEVLFLILILYFSYFLLTYFNIDIGGPWINLFIIAYFIYRIGDFSGLKEDIFKAVSKDSMKSILIVVLLNIFISYGLLYLSQFLLKTFPSLDFLVSFHLSSMYLINSIISVSFISTVFISPVVEELIFRGVLINKLNLIVPTTFSILITSLMFASLHSFGSIIAAFVFAVCMGILYVKTENIVVVILAHFLNNLIAESIVICDVNNVLFTNGIVVLIMSVLAIVSAVLIAVSIIEELHNLK
ncbi:hypothetical protein TL18_09990 [Methanobrevibacter sp. YE315]|uniref:CPBP family intramembrane glutamic endopeptidase n=1 Tax=Methanobrevibacter sp. YE315 TaxID=1609968 RepID=UPI000764E50C|nr:type II CAAX endopeptidase family protein [Methanobrevibacter sp. YE315]AMD18311.1 hypothetical protein TL18_09990 [Methanobrevibacter sp. YE315]